jgi:16S rRNA (cytosine1402-N4)-methyltransferase
MNVIHIPILVKTIVELVTEPFYQTDVPSVLIDATLGAGGHTNSFLNALNNTPHTVIAFDQDDQAIQHAKHRFAHEIKKNRLQLVHANFKDIQKHLPNQKCLGIFADLGFSSDQLENTHYGLSFQKDGPLDMRLNRESPLTCLTLLQTVHEKELADILFQYGEERYARKIARHLIQLRNKKQLPTTTVMLANAIQQVIPRTLHRTHPATKSFQAFRIVVNQELVALDLLLDSLPHLLKQRGRVGILSFHSLEDRKVKKTFLQKDIFIKINKKVIIPNEEEIKHNPRSRSSKLRVAEYIRKHD